MLTQSEDQKIQEIVRRMFEKSISFNLLLGLKVESIDFDRPRVRFEMREELIGNYRRGILHGGVIASVIDVTGGLVAYLGLLKRETVDTLEQIHSHFSHLGTIDMRIDYLRPGIGHWFEATGYILRIGRKVAVTRVELHNDKGNLIAVGTGAYTVS